jgi:hypothetical protein
MAYRLADNKLSDRSTWDDTEVAIQLKELSALAVDFDIEVTGFELPEIDLRIQSLDAADTADDADDFNVVMGPAVSQNGDFWQLDHHRILCGNAIDPMAYESVLGVDPDSTGKLGAVGFCFGGGVVNQLAVQMGTDLAAAVPFYGIQPSAEDTAKIKVPLLAHYGELDKRITSGWPAFDGALTAARVPHKGFVYAGANHGFHNDTTPRYDEAAAKLAWQRTLDWLNKYLRTSSHA